MLKKGIVFFVFIILLFSCKSTKVTDKNIKSLSAKNIIKKNTKATFDKKSVKASLIVKYIGKSNLPNLKASLRMEKDSIIWLSFSKLGFPVAKLMVSQNKVQFYEKITKTYFDGDFEWISKTLGYDFDFEMVQNLFLGNPLLNLKEDKYEVEIPKLGMVPIQDAESGKIILVNTNSKSVRNNYKANYLRNVDYFENSFKKSGSGTISTRIDESYVKKLLGYFKNRN